MTMIVEPAHVIAWVCPRDIGHQQDLRFGNSVIAKYLIMKTEGILFMSCGDDKDGVYKWYQYGDHVDDEGGGYSENDDHYPAVQSLMIMNSTSVGWWWWRWWWWCWWWWRQSWWWWRWWCCFSPLQERWGCLQCPKGMVDCAEEISLLDEMMIMMTNFDQHCLQFASDAKN